MYDFISLFPGAVPMFVQLLSSSHMNVVDQAVWALGNIAGDGTDCRDFTIQCGIIQPLINLIKPEMQVCVCACVCLVQNQKFSYKGFQICSVLVHCVTRMFVYMGGSISLNI